MKKTWEGFTTGRVLALLLAAALIMTLGVTAVASADGSDDELVVVEYAEPAVEAEETEEADEIAVLDEETLIRAAEEAKLAAEQPAEEPEQPVAEETAEQPAAEPKSFEDGYGNLSANLLNLASFELSNLTDAQRETIIEVWKANDLHLSPEQMLSVYVEAGLSAETGFVLLLANADACVRYVTENYDGGDDPVYVNTFAEGFADTCRALDWLESGALSDPESAARVIEIVGNGYAVMAEAGDTEGELLGYNPINDLVNAYGAAQGEADAQAFLALFA